MMAITTSNSISVNAPRWELHRKKREQAFMGCTEKRKRLRYAYPQGIATRLGEKIRPSAWPNF